MPDHSHPTPLFKMKREWRRISGRELPAILINFKEWITFYYVRGNQLHPLKLRWG